MLAPDYSLYLVTDRGLLQGRSLLEEVRKAVKGGVSMVQLREKEAGSREFYELAQALQAELRELGVPLLINDRLDIALAADADGLHLGQDDLPLPVARSLLGREKIIGLSINKREEAREGEKMGADYLGISPIFSTPTKLDAPPATGLEFLRSIRQEIKIPLVAIGGINKENLKMIKETGADGAAVISALMGASDIAGEARKLREIWERN
ncbi:MAG: thiamine phosphate synthase [Syntrophomonas sp.]|uniref:thiamine phosphate synthase n=1 Tax=Syntrophomonas sp. TaxID=2053627 RepID=UPI00262EAAA3|nr:thiamine phosphate synthase [Syntrophomonas sp.]MDD4627178.1 thiamine phosphate synthase [Syntrophomonas sp.]